MPAHHGLADFLQHTVDQGRALAAVLGHLGSSDDGRLHVHTGRVILCIVQVASAIEATTVGVVLLVTLAVT